MTAQTPIPDAGTPLRVVTDGGAVFCAVVRGAHGDRVLDLENPEVSQLRALPVQRGAEGTVHWGRPDAEYQARTRLLHEGDGTLRIELIGRWSRVQRREHVRARYAAKVTLVDVKGLRWQGATIDISESGLRCRVEQQARLKPRDLLMVSLALGAQQFDLASEVQWVAAGDEWHHEIGVHFVEPGRQADAIRGWVFSFQIRSKALL